LPDRLGGGVTLYGLESVLGLAHQIVASDSVVDGVVSLGATLPLHHGGTLTNAVMAYRLVGPVDAPVVVAIGGISGDRFVAAEDHGWWANVVGAGLAIDTKRVRVLGIDYLGGSGDSTSASGDTELPLLSAYDQAAALAKLIERLDLSPVQAVVGASYGGLVALGLAKCQPHCAKQVVAISVAERAHPHASALRSVQREIVRFGLDHHAPEHGLKLARALAMCTYRTKREFKERFEGDPRPHGERVRLPVEDYIYARGTVYTQKYQPRGFLALSESIDLFQIDASEVVLPTRVIAVPEDELVPFADSERLAARLPKGELLRLHSHCGHDGFLKEGTQLRELLKCLYSAGSLNS
jgi:homoserine O-acetyltransferase/O-succinyltransferase